jgi:hypothetical protein
VDQTSDLFFDQEDDDINFGAFSPQGAPEDASLRKTETKLLDSIEKLVRQRVATVSKEIKERSERLSVEMQKPKFFEASSKTAFVVGVMLTVTTALIVGRSAQWLPNWYLLWAIILLSSRFFMYHKLKEHYFMIDFCYFSNFLLLFYLFLYPTSPHLFILNMANCNGPLLWAIIAWKNALVFHDMDKITSVFIHAFPVIVTYVIRWFPEMHDFAICTNPSCQVSFFDVILPHVSFYILWQLSYYVKTEVIDREYMEKRQEIVTSFRYLTKDEKSTAFKIVNVLGPRYRVLIFMLFQLVYHVLTVAPVYLMWHYQWLHTLFITFVFSQCVWNGASFYFSPRFFKMYLTRLESIKKMLEQEQHKPINS